jgi:hypothetical protein
MVVDVMAAGSVVEDKAILFRKRTTWRGLIEASFGITCVIPIANPVKPAVTAGGAEMWKTRSRFFGTCVLRHNS